jgi:3-phenylpropionate/trans-cinnamate dioxygenase ferredoxin subunit
MATEERLCAVDDLAPGEARRFELGNLKIALVRIADDFYAIGDVCTHQDISLAEGEIHADEREIECWKHGSTFSLVTGEPQSLPATVPVPVYDVRVEGNEIYVEVSD